MDNIQVNSGSDNDKSKQQNRTKRELILPWYFWLYKSLRPVQCFADHRGQLQDVPPRDILFPVGPSHCSGQVSSNGQNKKLVFVQGTDQNVGSCENPALLQKVPQKKSSAEGVEEEGIDD